MRLDGDGHQRIAVAARPGLALAGQPHLGAILQPGGQLEVDGLAIGQRDPLRSQFGRIGQGYRQAILNMAAARGLPGATERATATKAATARAAPAAEQPIENAAKVDPFGPATLKPCEILGPKAAPPAAKPATGAAAKAGGVASAVDLAPVELGALGRIRQQVIGLCYLGKALRRARIIGVPIGVQLLRQLAIGGLDVLLARTA